MTLPVNARWARYSYSDFRRVSAWSSVFHVRHLAARGGRTSWLHGINSGMGDGVDAGDVVTGASRGSGRRCGGRECLSMVAGNRSPE